MWSKLENFICPLITFLALLAAWYAYVSFYDVPDYLLPRPEAVLNSVIFAYGEGYIWPHLLFTTQSTILGYFLGCSIGIFLGATIAESKIFEKFFYPYVIVIQSMPKVALAPLIIVWFGYGIESKIVMVALISFFPVFINTFVGIRQADQDLINVLRVCSASRLHIFFHVKLPSAAGSIFAGLQIAVVLSLIGAIVAEFVASQKGLGTVIQRGALDMDTSLMLTGVFTLAAMGLIGNMIVRMVHERVVFWETQKGGETANQLEAA